MDQQKPVTTAAQNVQSKRDFLKVIVQDVEKALVTLENILPKINNCSNIAGDIIAGDTIANDADMNLFTTTVHGMKSAMLNIGETELSAAALKLEKAGETKNIAEISADALSFLNALRAVIEKHKPKAIDKTANISDDDIAELTEKLLKLKNACGKIQKGAAKAMLDGLREKTWPHVINELFDELSMYLLHGEFKKAVSAIEKSQKILFG